MTARNKPSKYCKGAIACDYLCGDTMQTIRANYGIASYMTIERALDTIGGHERIYIKHVHHVEAKRGLSIDKCAEIRDRAIEAYKTGEYTQRQVAEIVGVSYYAVTRMLHLSGCDGYEIDLNRKRKARKAELEELGCTKYTDRAIYWTLKTGAQYDAHINLDKLIDRDGTVCRRCGKKTTKESKEWGAFGADYPTIDHIVPLSKGGSHTWDNVQLLCGKCNIEKGDRV